MAQDRADEPRAQFTPIFETSPCSFDLPDGVAGDRVVCGFVVVPEDHSDPSGPTIRLATAIIKAEAELYEPDPLILLAGGPGENVVKSTVPLAQILAPLRAGRDLVIFDQRGAGLSQPALECPEVVRAAQDLLGEPDLNVAARISFESVIACRDRLVAEGHNLGVYRTSQNAADVEAIRIALGFDQVNLYGGSYGSQLAQAVMRDYPAGVRSVVMESIYPLEASLLVAAATTVPKTILSLIEACTADPDCNAAYPDLRSALYEVIDRLNVDPVFVTLTHPTTGETYNGVLSGDTILGSLRTILYVTDALPAVPAAIYDMHNGDFGLMARLASLRLAFLDAVSIGMEYSTLCAEDLIGHSSSDLLEAQAALPRQLAGTVSPETTVEYGIFAICEAWPVEEAPHSVKEPLISSIPALLLSGQFDHVTPPEYGRTVASRLENSFFFELPAGGHSGENFSDCAMAMTAAFLDDPTVEPDATCIETMSDLVFDLTTPTAELVLEPFTDEARGFGGLIPAGWQALDATNLARRQSALDPTYFVLEATSGTANDLFASLAGQIGIDSDFDPINVAEMGGFNWTFYTVELGGNVADIALAENDGSAYFVFMISTPEEHSALHESLFLPAVAALRALD